MQADIIDKWNKKHYLIENVTFDNPLSIRISQGQNRITEGLIKTYPIGITKRYLQKLYGFDEGQIEIYENNSIEKIRIIIPNKETFIDKIKSTLNLCGYFCSKEGNYPYIDNWVYLNFEPKIQSNVNDYVRQMSYIYHVTPSKYINKIAKIGLKPNFKNNFFTYPDRVYFFVNETIPNEIYQLKQQLKQNNEKYSLLIIDVSKMPEHINFFLDPNYDYGIYTNDNIPPDCIIEIYDMID